MANRPQVQQVREALIVCAVACDDDAAAEAFVALADKITPTAAAVLVRLLK